MNRLSPLVPQVASQTSAGIGELASVIDFGKVERGTRNNSPHALFMPMHYEPNYAYPLIVWLHGPGDDERQLQRIMPLVSLRNYLAVGPRASHASKSERGFEWKQSEAAIADAEASVFQCIDVVTERFNVAPERIFLGGFASGGTMAFRVGLRHPGRFGGVLSLGGTFPTGHMPLARLAQVRRLPLFIAQGRDAQRYSVERSCQELRLFHTAGLAVTVRQYPCGDELTTTMLGDMDRWIMERVTGVEQTLADETPSLGAEYN